MCVFGHRREATPDRYHNGSAVDLIHDKHLGLALVNVVMVDADRIEPEIISRNVSRLDCLAGKVKTRPEVKTNTENLLINGDLLSGCAISPCVGYRSVKRRSLAQVMRDFEGKAPVTGTNRSGGVRNHSFEEGCMRMPLSSQMSMVMSKVLSCKNYWRLRLPKPRRSNWRLQLIMHMTRIRSHFECL